MVRREPSRLEWKRLGNRIVDTLDIVQWPFLPLLALGCVISKFEEQKSARISFKQMDAVCFDSKPGHILQRPTETVFMCT